MAPAASQAAPADGQRAPRRVGFAEGAPTQRDRLVAAMGELTAEVGSAATGVHHVCQRAGVSRRTFYELYPDREACFVDAQQEAFGRLLSHLDSAVADAGPEWEDRAVAVTQGMLGAWDADRILARLCLISSIGGNDETLALRRATIAQIVALLAGAPSQPLAAEPVLAGALGSVWELAFRELTDDRDNAISELAGVAIYLMLAPFVGRRQAAARAAGRGSATAYVTRWTPTVTEGVDDRGLLVTELTGQTLRFLSRRPGAANIDIARAVDVRHESQMSRHLARLERAGMVSHQREGRTNAWMLTARGEEAARTLGDLRGDGPRLTASAWAATDREGN